MEWCLLFLEFAMNGGAPQAVEFGIRCYRWKLAAFLRIARRDTLLPVFRISLLEAYPNC